MGVSGEPLLKNTPSSDENRVRFNEIGSDVLRWIFGNDWIKESISARIWRMKTRRKKQSIHFFPSACITTYIWDFMWRRRICIIRTTFKNYLRGLSNTVEQIRVVRVVKLVGKVTSGSESWEVVQIVPNVTSCSSCKGSVFDSWNCSSRNGVVEVVMWLSGESYHPSSCSISPICRVVFKLWYIVTVLAYNRHYQ